MSGFGFLLEKQLYNLFYENEDKKGRGGIKERNSQAKNISSFAFATVFFLTKLVAVSVNIEFFFSEQNNV